MSRASGIDLIKVVAVVMVPSLHFFLNWHYGQPMTHVTSVLAIGIRWVSMACIGLFIASTGYLQSVKEPTRAYYLKLLPYVGVYGVYCVLTAALGGWQGLWLRAAANFFQFPSYFWYMGFFIGMYVLIPFLNLIVGALAEISQFQKFLGALIAVVSLSPLVNSLPALFGGQKIVYLPAWWETMFPLVYFFIGAYFRKFRPQFNKWMLLGAMVAVAFGASALAYLFSAGGQPVLVGGNSYASIVLVTVTICVFGIVYDLTVSNEVVRRTARFFGSITLEIYLGLIIADHFTSAVMRRVADYSDGTWPLRYYFVIVPVNFGLAVGLAIIVYVIVRAWTAVVRRTKAALATSGITQRTAPNAR